MRKLWSLVIATALVLPAIPVTASSTSGGAAKRQQVQQQGGSINGTARGAKGEALPNTKVRVRDKVSGAVIAEGTSTETGAFTVAGLAPGSYVVEIVNGAGQLVGLSSAVAVTAGAATTVAVTATAAGSMAAAAAGGGFGILGLGTAASVAVIGGAAAAGVAGVAAANGNASPSR